MTIRYRPLPFGETNTNGCNDCKTIATDEPIATNRATRRLMEKLARKGGSCTTPPKSKKKTPINHPEKAYRLTRRGIRGIWTFY